MNSLLDTMRDAVISATQSTKISMAVTTGTAAMGAAAKGEEFHNILANVSMILGCVATAVLIVCHLIRVGINLQEYKRASRLNEQRDLEEANKTQGEKA